MSADVPSYDRFIEPLFKALKLLGGSGNINEINRKVFEIMRLTEEQLALPHNPEKGNQSKAEYRMAWARTYLKSFGFIDNSSRGVWSLTASGNEANHIDTNEVVRVARERMSKHSVQNGEESIEDSQETILSEGLNTSWQQQLIDIMLQLSPDSFERFCQRLLRESGFIQVNVTGRSGDGGIDGNGIIRIAGLISFPVVFQCKRYQGRVSAAQVRDFRGAMIGRAEKGLIITTGTFTRDAQREATRDGAPVIDLVDGELLVEKVRELRLGVEVKMVEQVTVDINWFAESF